MQVCIVSEEPTSTLEPESVIPQAILPMVQNLKLFNKEELSQVFVSQITANVD